ncbi:MAG: MrtP family glutamic-type intramembrane protease [Myxococcota bacterium]|nr:MrtP family glutamic-type intramembrane protease [Myxococcota bacterium]
MLWATAGATAACAALSFAQEFWPLLRANLYVVVAAIFLYLPVVLLRRRGLSTLDVGLTTRPRVRGLLFAVGACLLVFPPYLVGFHFWQGWAFARQPHFTADAYRRWPAEWEGRPAAGASPQAVVLFTEGNELVLRLAPPPGGPLELELVTDGRLERLAGPSRGLTRLAPGRLRLQAGHPGELRLRVSGGQQLTVHASHQGQPLAPAAVALGAGSQRPGELPVRGTRGLGWLALLVLSHLLLVALPEELFYRGYAQTTLDQVFPRRVRVLGVELGLSVLVVSVLFALGHFLVDLRVERLAVFFPSLLFGYLRAGSGSLLAPILVHAASNVFSDLLAKGYLP